MELNKIFKGHIVYVFREVRRVLRKDGILWLNLGDSYAGSWGGTSKKSCELYPIQQNNRGSMSLKVTPPQAYVKESLKPKDLCGIPWRVAFALQGDGWWLRQDNIEKVELYCPNCGYGMEEHIERYSQDQEIIWHKPNPMPSSVKDRCTTAHEYIFLLSKSAKYYFDAEAIKTPLKEHSLNEYPFSDGSKQDVMIRQRGKWKMLDGWDTGEGAHGSFHREGREKGKRKEFDSSQAGGGSTFKKGHSGNYDANGNLIGNGKANKRSVWSFPTQSFKDAHFATFPLELPLTCIKAGCPEGGIVLDPFFGSGTTGEAALKLNRNFIGVEIKQEYIDIAERRLAPYREIQYFDFREKMEG